MKFTRKYSIPAGCLALIVTIGSVGWSGADSNQKQTKIEADYSTFNATDESRVFRGNVVIAQDNMTVIADYVKITTKQDGEQLIEAQGTPIKFQVEETQEDDAADGVADQVVIDYSTDIVTLTGNVAFEAKDAFIKTHIVIYNLTSGDYESSGADTEEGGAPKRTTIVLTESE